MAATERAARLLAQLKEKEKQKNNANSAPDISNLDPRAIEAAKRLDEIAAEPEPDYLSVCREYQRKYNVSMFEAQREIDRTYPHLRRAFLKKHNPHLSEEDF